MTEKQKYFHLVGEVCEMLNPSVVDQAVRNGHPMPIISLNNVRLGRKVDLAALTQLVRLGLPEFDIPAHLRPGQVDVPLFER